MTPKEVRQLWVKALRSGEYKQGKSCLRTNDGGQYCCLGVLTDLAVKNKVIPEFTGLAGMNNILDRDVMRWAGLSDEYGSYGDYQTLTRLNDEGCNFDRIASVIEAEPKRLLIESI